MFAVFPGQGAQYVGMGKELSENFAIARETIEEASDAISLNLKKLCFEGPESDLTLTENTQPSLLTVSVAAFRVAEKEFGFKPSLVAGHSLGEYSALVAAGAIPFAKAALWVRTRGQAMQEAVPAGEGTMAAIMGLEDGAVRELCAKAADEIGKTLEPANFNAPGQVVIAGATAAVEKAVEIAPSLGRAVKAVKLSVSAPFHCSMMKKAREKMADVFSDESPGALNCPYIPNRTAEMASNSDPILKHLVEQIDHPVLWKQSFELAMNEGKEKAVEFGPGKVLQGLSKRISRSLKKPMSVHSAGDKDSMSSLEAFLSNDV